MDTSDLPEILKIKLWHLDAGYLLRIEGGLSKRNIFVDNIREAKGEINKYIDEEYLTEGGEKK